VDRTRAAAPAALFVVLAVAGAALAAGSSPATVQLGAVSWPVATLLVSEVQTGGASASDEFAEITNVGATAVDLAGLELVYVTSTGSTVTRKASWPTSLLLQSGRHLFVANTSGVYAGLADATYSGGFAATGGAIALRVIGGAVIDAVGWGDATNAFVEGSPVGAPAAGSSVERRPGGLAGNTIDTNSNSADWFLQPSPNPQSLAAPPVPAPGSSATPAPTIPAPTPIPTSTTTPVPTESVLPTELPTSSPTVTPVPTAEPTIEPSAEPTLEPTAVPTAPPTPEPTVAPTPEPTAEPTAEPTLEATATPAPPTPTPTAGPTATPGPVVSIATARAQADGSVATISGILTTPLGGLESGRKAFVQDETAGIAIYLDTAVVAGLPAGSMVLASGTIDDRFAERTLRVNLVDVVTLGDAALPAPISSSTASIGEAVEGSRVLVTGLTVGTPSDLADGLGLMVDDGSGSIRVIVAPAALGGLSVPAGTQVVAVGPVGQRDSSGTGLAGYRIHVTQAGDFQIVPPTPSPTPGPTATPTAAPTPAATPTQIASPTPGVTLAPSPSPTAGPTVAPTSSPTAQPTPAPRPTATTGPTATPGPTPPPVIDIVEARGVQVGTVVTVAGVVTAEAGRLGIPPVLAIADGTGGIAIRLPDGASSPARGVTVLVRGQLADPYGQLEIRPGASGFSATGRGSLPVPLRVTAAQLGEATEGRLAEIVGTVTGAPRKGTSGDLTIDLVDAVGAAFRVVADGSSGIGPTDLVKDRAYRLTGIVGQRASRKGALDGYRIYPRDRADIVATTAPAGPGSSQSPSGTGAARVVPIATALSVPDGTRVTIEATVTAGASLLDSSGRRIVVQDRSGAIEVLLPSGTSAPTVGAIVRVTGTSGLAWGAPRLAATAIDRLGGGTIAPVTLRRAPADRDEWQLARISGTVAKVSRIGERWKADVALPDGTAVLVQGQAGAGIPSTTLIVGRQVTVIGIVRRPYPTASDRRFSILPRGAADVALGDARPGASGTAAGASAGTAGVSAGDPAGIRAAAAAVTPDTDLATLGDAIGASVKVGGLVARVAERGFDLDDGTALARIELRGDMAALLPHIRAGEAVAATGRVELVDGAPAVVVDNQGTLVRVGVLGEGLPISPGTATNAGDQAHGAPITADSSGGLGGPAPVSLLALASLTALSALATVVRRRLLQRRLRFALIGRLGGLERGTPAVESGKVSVEAAPAEHESA